MFFAARSVSVYKRTDLSLIKISIFVIKFSGGSLVQEWRSMWWMKWMSTRWRSQGVVGSTVLPRSELLCKQIAFKMST